MHYDCILIVPQEGILSQEAADAGIVYRVQPCRLFYSMMEPHAGLHDELEYIRANSEWKEIIQLLQELAPDYVLTNTSVHAIPALAAKSLKIPVIWQITEKITDNIYTRNAADLVRRFADAVICISQTTAHFLTQPDSTSPTFPCPPIFILPPSWYEEEIQAYLWPQRRGAKRAELGVASHERLIGYISSTISPAKGLKDFVQMALRLAAFYPDTRYIVLGTPSDIPYFEQCKELIMHSSVRERFIFKYFENQVKQLYPAMDIVVIPSVIPEGFGIAAMEGLIYGKPVVVYRSGGLEEIHQATDNERFIADTGRWEQLVSIVGGLLNDPQQINIAGLHNRSKVWQVYGIDKYRSRLRAFCAHFIKDRPKRSVLPDGSYRELGVNKKGGGSNSSVDRKVRSKLDSRTAQGKKNKRSARSKNSRRRQGFTSKNQSQSTSSKRSQRTARRRRSKQRSSRTLSRR